MRTKCSSFMLRSLYSRQIPQWNCTRGNPCNRICAFSSLNTNERVVSDVDVNSEGRLSGNWQLLGQG